MSIMLYNVVHRFAMNPSYSYEELERPEGPQGKLALTSYRWLTTLRTAGMSFSDRLPIQGELSFLLDIRMHLLDLVSIIGCAVLLWPLVRQSRHVTIPFGSDPQVEATDQRAIFDSCLDMRSQPHNPVTLHTYILNI